MKFTTATAVTVFAALAMITGPAQASVVTFGTGSVQAAIFTPWVEDGMTMTPIFDGSSAGAPHWDLISLCCNATPADNNAAIHRGNAGDKVQFDTGGGAFDLLSLDIEFYELNAPSLTVTFDASSGATHSITSPFLGTIDFSSLSGWSNITSFTMEVPLGNYICTAGVDCSNVFFDNVVFRSPAAVGGVPEPATLALFGTGLAGFAAMRRRRKAKA